jgi:hypothetical protein
MRSQIRRVAAPHRYANLPTWVFVSNAVGICVGWTLFALVASSHNVDAIFLIIVAWMAFVGHFLLVALPSFGKVLFAEQVSPLQRMIGLGLIGAGVAGTASASLGLLLW